MPDAYDTYHDLLPDIERAFKSHLNTEAGSYPRDNSEACKGLLTDLNREFFPVDAATSKWTTRNTQGSGDLFTLKTGEMKLFISDFASINTWQQTLRIRLEGWMKGKEVTDPNTSEKVWIRGSSQSVVEWLALARAPGTDAWPADWASCEDYLKWHIAAFVQTCASWERVKDVCLAPKQDDGAYEAIDQALLTLCRDMRKSLADEAVKKLKEKLPDLVAWGYSQDELGSCYDLTFGGNGDVSALAEFNEAFRTYWHSEPGTALDMNVCVRDWLLVKDTLGGNDREDGSFQVECEDYLDDTFSLMKICRFTTSEEWDAFIKAIGKDLTVSGEESKNIDLFKRLTRISGGYTAMYLSPILKQASAIEKSWKAEVKSLTLKRSERKRIIKSTGHTKLERLIEHDSDAVLKANNLAYLDLACFLREKEEEIIGKNSGYTKVRHIAPDGTITYGNSGLTNRGLNKFITKITKYIGEAALFCNHGSHSQGAVWDAVSYGDVSYPSTPWHCLHAFNEQFAEAVKEFRYQLFTVLEAKEQKVTIDALYQPGSHSRPSPYPITMKRALERLIAAIKKDREFQHRLVIHKHIYPDDAGCGNSEDKKALDLLEDELGITEVLQGHARKLNLLRRKVGEKSLQQRQEAIVAFGVGEIITDQHLIDWDKESRRPGKVELGLPDGFPEAHKKVFWAYRQLLWHGAYVNRLARIILAGRPNDAVVSPV